MKKNKPSFKKNNLLLIRSAYCAHKKYDVGGRVSDEEEEWTVGNKLGRKRGSARPGHQESGGCSSFSAILIHSDHRFVNYSGHSHSFLTFSVVCVREETG